VRLPPSLSAIEKIREIEKRLKADRNAALGNREIN